MGAVAASLPRQMAAFRRDRARLSRRYIGCKSQPLDTLYCYGRISSWRAKIFARNRSRYILLNLES